MGRYYDDDDDDLDDDLDDDEDFDDEDDDDLDDDEGPRESYRERMLASEADRILKENEKLARENGRLQAEKQIAERGLKAMQKANPMEKGEGFNRGTPTNAEAYTDDEIIDEEYRATGRDPDSSFKI